MISFCAATSASSCVDCPPPPIDWLWAWTNSSVKGFTSRKNMSLFASLDGFARAMSRAFA